MSSTPTGWTVVALSEVVAEAQPGFASGEDLDEGGVFQFRMNNLDREGGLDLSKKRRVPFDPAKSEKFLLHPGDVLFNATNSPEMVGKSAYFGGHEEPAVFSNHFLRLRPGPSLDGRFLARWLQHQFQRGVFAAGCRKWVNQATYGKDSLLGLGIPLPPLEEQRRIAAILDKADELRAKRRAVLEHLDTLTQSIFLDMFGDPALNRHGWPEKPLGELGLVATGGTPSRERPEYFDGCIPWVKTTEVDGGTIRRTSESISEDALRDSNCQVFPEGSVVIAMYGQGATRGRTSILGLPAATNQACAVVVTGDLMEPTYLHTVLQLAYHRLRGLGRGGNQANLNLALVRSFEVPMPPLRKQVEFASARAEVDEMRRTTANSDVEMAALRSSLEARAFSGEL